jgi:hypothetical protein
LDDNNRLPGQKIFRNRSADVAIGNPEPLSHKSLSARSSGAELITASLIHDNSKEIIDDETRWQTMSRDDIGLFCVSALSHWDRH